MSLKMIFYVSVAMIRMAHNAKTNSHLIVMT